jgi:hypothetical protein
VEEAARRNIEDKRETEERGRFTRGRDMCVFHGVRERSVLHCRQRAKVGHGATEARCREKDIGRDH